MTAFVLGIALTVVSDPGAPAAYGQTGYGYGYGYGYGPALTGSGSAALSVVGLALLFTGVVMVRSGRDTGQSA